MLPDDFNRSEAEARLLASDVLIRSARSTGEKSLACDSRLPELIAYYDNVQLPADRPSKCLEILRSRAVIHTLYSSAGRVSEIVALTRDQVQSGSAGIVSIPGRGSKPRLLYLTHEAQAAIRAYCAARQDNSPALFISHGRGKGGALTRARVWQTVRDAAKVLGIAGTVSPNAFRHYRATQLLNEGMSLEFVQEYLGHASPATTRMVYAQVQQNVLIDQLNTYGLSAKQALDKTRKQQEKG
jgi:site-specific recombinase XerD